MVSHLGAMIQAVGAAWMMSDLGGSPLMIALVQASATLPMMLLSLLAGAVADSLDRRRVMLVAQIFMFSVSAVLAACASFGVLSPWLLLIFTFLVGCGTAVNSPAWQAAVGDMVPRAALPGAIAMNSMGYNVARSLGPAAGGILVASLGAPAVFWSNVASYLGLIVVLARWRPPVRELNVPRERIVDAMAAGVGFVLLSPTIRSVLLRALVFSIPASALLALAPLIARDRLDGGVGAFGALLAAFGVGAITGAFSTSSLRRRLSPETIVRLSIVAVAVGTLGAGLGQTIWMTATALATAGMGWVLTLAAFNVAVQLSSPGWVVARALALYQMSAFGGMALGSWLFGALAERSGIGPALATAAVALVAGVILTRGLALPHDAAPDLRPLGRFQPPPRPALIDDREGPIVISITYRIPQHRQAAFLNVMLERRRIRRRDGAQRWRLLRDLTDPDVWVERYVTPTWHDYLRHNSRQTRADIKVSDALLALHGPAHPPEVHRMIEQPTTYRRSATAFQITSPDP